MQAGLLRDIISIERAEETRSDTGAQVMTWTTYWTGRAWVRYSSGGRTLMNDEYFNNVTRKVVIRWIPGVVPTMRIKIGGNYYRILSIDESTHDRSITLITELIND